MQRLDDHFQEEEGGVDVLRFLQGLAAGPRLGDALGPREIDEMQLRALDDVGAVPSRFQADGEDAVRAAGGLVHRGLADGPIGVSQEQEVQRLLLGSHAVHPQILQVEVAILVLEHADFRQILQPRSASLLCQQVETLVVVDLQVADEGLEVRVVGLLKFGEHEADGPRNETSVRVALSPARDGEGLAATGLPVGKDRRVEALQRPADGIATDRIEGLLLRAFWTEDGVEPKLPERARIVHDPRGPLRRRQRNLHGDLAFFQRVFFEKARGALRRPNPQDDLDVVIPHPSTGLACQAAAWRSPTRRTYTRTQCNAVQCGTRC
mmetsp:Transcript_1917/g.8490  ORF Transcript_1917/g.8490 Transcript_1917/m.8490 type:complete len:322 (+) Transcript_1917:766-1731(+)